MTLVRVNPRLQNNSLGHRYHQWLDDVHPELRDSYENRRDCVCPRMDVGEKENEGFVNIELPGVKKEDVSITFEKDILTIKGEKKNESDDEKFVSERRYGKFTRKLQVLFNVESDKIKAVFNDGVLSITLPKAADAKEKTIKVS